MLHAPMILLQHTINVILWLAKMMKNVTIMTAKMGIVGVGMVVLTPAQKKPPINFIDVLMSSVTEIFNVMIYIARQEYVSMIRPPTHH